MKMECIVTILGSNRARCEVKNMVKALSFFTFFNSPEETKRLNAGKAALSNWKKYQSACNAIRDSKTKKGYTSDYI